MTTKKKLDAREQIFKEQFLLTGKPHESALTAGYAASTAKTKAFSWVSDSKCPENKRHVLEAIMEAQHERSKNANIDAQWVLDELVKCYQANLGDLLVVPKSGGLPYYDLTKATPEQMSSIESLQIDTYFDGRGPDAEEVKKIAIKLPGKLKTLELIGKHVSVGAYKDRLDLNANININIDGQDADL